MYVCAEVVYRSYTSQIISSSLIDKITTYICIWVS